MILGALAIALGGVSRWLGGASYTWLFVGQTLNGAAGPVSIEFCLHVKPSWLTGHMGLRLRWRITGA